MSNSFYATYETGHDMNRDQVVTNEQMTVWKSRVREYLTCQITDFFEEKKDGVDNEALWNAHFVRASVWNKRDIIFGNPVFFAALVKLTMEKCEALYIGGLVFAMNDECERAFDFEFKLFFRAFFVFFLKTIFIDSRAFFLSDAILDMKITRPIQYLVFYDKLLLRFGREFRSVIEKPSIEEEERNFFNLCMAQFTRWKSNDFPEIEEMVYSLSSGNKKNRSSLSMLSDTVIGIVLEKVVELFRRDFCFDLKIRHGNSQDGDDTTEYEAFFEEEAINDMDVKDFLFDSGAVPDCL